MKKLATSLLATGFIAACSSVPESFEPTERATAMSPQGDLAADYPIRGPAGDLGEVKVWSRGTYRANVDGGERTVLHVAFDVDNSSDETLTLDASQIVLESGIANKHEIGELRPERLLGETTIAPRDSGTIEAYFALPAG